MQTRWRMPMLYPTLNLPAPSEVGVLSRGLSNIPHLSRLLGHPVVLPRHKGWLTFLLSRRWCQHSFTARLEQWLYFKRPVTAIAGWGHKATAAPARQYAARHRLRYLALEDGFLRSLGLGHDSPPQSLVIDDLGIYYNASAPSRLEQLVAQTLTPAQHARATSLIARWRDAAVSKYNHLREYEADLPSQYVLLADQTLGDASVTLGGANSQSFTAMIDAALRLYPEATLLLKTHPEVMAGKKRGYLDPKRYATHPRIQVLSQAVHPVRLIKEAQAVFTVTSQLGFEGLLWGKPVHTFGMPFYAGWGLTLDALNAPARRSRVSLEQLTHAALIDYARYLHPDTEQGCEVEELLAWLQHQRNLRTAFAPRIYGLGFSLNKQVSIKKFLAGSEVVFVQDLNHVEPNSTVAVWGSTQVARPDLKVLRLEDGFLRSAGLGADLVRPLSYVVDALGIYYDATRCSTLEQRIQSRHYSPEVLERARALQQRIVSAGISKYNLAGTSWVRPERATHVLLVAGQVESDASIALGAPQVKHNIALLRAVRQAHPTAYILYKPHPDVAAKLRRAGLHEQQATQYCDELVSGVSITQLFSQVDEVHVMTSLTGFEALLHGCTVVTYGLPFYAGWGLTTDHCSIARRTARPTLTELVAATLILYPRYVLPHQTGFASPEAVLAWLEAQAKQHVAFKPLRQALRRAIARLTTQRH